MKRGLAFVVVLGAVILPVCSADGEAASRAHVEYKRGRWTNIEQFGRFAWGKFGGELVR